MIEQSVRLAPAQRIELRPRPITCLSRGVVAWSECERELALMRRRYLDASEHARGLREVPRGRS